jgi:hypothetical protein
VESFEPNEDFHGISPRGVMVVPGEPLNNNQEIQDKNDCIPSLPKVFEEIETQTNIYNQSLFEKA